MKRSFPGATKLKRPTIADTDAKVPDDALLQLYYLHVQFKWLNRRGELEQATPLNALESAVISHKIGQPIPAWAAHMIESLLDSIVFQKTDLNLVFGLKVSRGKTPEFDGRLREFRDDSLMFAVWFETLSGATIENACSIVAHK